MISMGDIADKAGVSRAAVSFVLNNRQRVGGSISESTRHRVLEVAAELGYRRNELARAVVSGKNRMIGFVAGYTRSESAARILSGVIEAVEERDYSVKILALSSNNDVESVAVRCVELRLAGVLALNLENAHTTRLAQEMARYEMPMAFIDRRIELEGTAMVTADDKLGLELAVGHLAELGHRKIAFLSGAKGDAMSVSREEAFRAAMGAHRLPLEADSIVNVVLKTEAIEAAATALLQNAAPRPTALIGITDAAAMLAVRAAHTLKLALPTDLSIVGYAGLSSAELCTPALTTVRLPFFEMGARAATLLIESVESKPPGLHREAAEFLRPQLVVRASTAKPVSGAKL